MWTARADPFVLRARLNDAAALCAPAIDLSRWPHLALQGDACIHLRLHLPGGVLRLDCVGRGFLSGLVAIEPAIDFSRAIEPQIASLSKLDAFLKGDRVALRDQAFVRLLEALRVADALESGASLRAIGLGIYGGDWPGDGEHLKSKVRRRVALADRLLHAGPRSVLAG